MDLLQAWRTVWFPSQPYTPYLNPWRAVHLLTFWSKLRQVKTSFSKGYSEMKVLLLELQAFLETLMIYFHILSHIMRFLVY